MQPSGRTSNCSLGVPVDYFWVSCSDPQRHVEEATAAVMAALHNPARRWSPYNETMTRREIHRRLLLAARGELTPVDHVKPLRDGRTHLFEIRWAGVSVTEATPDGGVRHVKAHARLYHAEPPHLILAAVGLHAHEKIIYADDAARTKREQDAEIDRAEELFWSVARTYHPPQDEQDPAGTG